MQPANNCNLHAAAAAAGSWQHLVRQPGAIAAFGIVHVSLWLEKGASTSNGMLLPWQQPGPVGSLLTAFLYHTVQHRQMVLNASPHLHGACVVQLPAVILLAIECICAHQQLPDTCICQFTLD
jgi:hypothetical protein